MILTMMGMIVFVYGLCVGSFLNVCIYRIPESKSVVSPGSSCPVCGFNIRFYDNIPVFSYLFLRGKCRNCGHPISIRYPAIEVLTGIFALLVFYKFDLSVSGLVYFLFISVLIVITFIDIDHQIIPDVISLPGIPICFLLSLWVGGIDYYKTSILGILAGGGSLFLVAWTYKMMTGKDGMGGGDIKLLAMIGALIGWQGVLFTIFSGSAIGTFGGVLSMIGGRQMNMKLAIPFGPFLSGGAVLYIFYGPQIISWYFKTLA